MEDPDMGHPLADRFVRTGHPSIKELVAEQGAKLGDVWPEQESIDDFLSALHEWRGHDRSDRAA